jgi:hypothetical protein
VAASKFIKLSIKFARLEGAAYFDFLSSVPPIGIASVKYALGSRFRGRCS